MPKATVARLPLYLRALGALSTRVDATVSSEGLAALVGMNAAKVRKDLSYLGALGRRGTGYEVTAVMARIRSELGLTREWPVVIVGAGNLGRALALYDGFRVSGFDVVALVDSDSSKIGTQVGSLTVHSAGDLGRLVASHRVEVGVIATPARASQDVADTLTAVGVRAILSFAPTSIIVPRGVVLREVDLSNELQILSFHLRHGPDANLVNSAGGAS